MIGEMVTAEAGSGAALVVELGARRQCAEAEDRVVQPGDEWVRRRSRHSGSMIGQEE
jgi:hypothetical protein